MIQKKRTVTGDIVLHEVQNIALPTPKTQTVQPSTSTATVPIHPSSAVVPLTPGQLIERQCSSTVATSCVSSL